MINRVILIGNLGRDPEVRRLENGVVVAKFPIATNENYRDKSGEWKQLTEWHDIVVWRDLAERAGSTLKKGSMVYVEGKLSHRTWQDQEGNNRRITEVVANYFRNISPRRDGDEGGSAGEPSSAEEAPPPHVDTAEEPPSVEAPEAADDDLPF